MQITIQRDFLINVVWSRVKLIDQHYLSVMSRHNLSSLDLCMQQNRACLPRWYFIAYESGTTFFSFLSPSLARYGCNLFSCVRFDRPRRRMRWGGNPADECVAEELAIPWWLDSSKAASICKFEIRDTSLNLILLQGEILYSVCKTNVHAIRCFDSGFCGKNFDGKLGI